MRVRLVLCLSLHASATATASARPSLRAPSRQSTPKAPPKMAGFFNKIKGASTVCTHSPPRGRAPIAHAIFVAPPRLPRSPPLLTKYRSRSRLRIPRPRRPRPRRRMSPRPRSHRWRRCSRMPVRCEKTVATGSTASRTYVSYPGAYYTPVSSTDIMLTPSPRSSATHGTIFDWNAAPRALLISLQLLQLYRAGPVLLGLVSG